MNNSLSGSLSENIMKKLLNILKWITLGLFAVSFSFYLYFYSAVKKGVPDTSPMNELITLKTSSNYSYEINYNGCYSLQLKAKNPIESNFSTPLIIDINSGEQFLKASDNSFQFDPICGKESQTIQLTFSQIPKELIGKQFHVSMIVFDEMPDTERYWAEQLFPFHQKAAKLFLIISCILGVLLTVLLIVNKR